MVFIAEVLITSKIIVQSFCSDVLATNEVIHKGLPSTYVCLALLVIVGAVILELEVGDGLEDE